MKALTCFISVSMMVWLSDLALHAQTVKMLTPLATFGLSNDGSIPPGSGDPYPPMDTGNNQRGLAYDPVSGNLVLVDTHSGSGGSNGVQGAIYIVDGTYGTNISTLNTNGIAGGTYADTAAVVADDGVVYVCNQVVNSSNNPFIIYRWDSVHSTDPPSICFSNTIVPAQRYGSSIAIRGAGPNTQILIGSLPDGSSGTNVVLFTTADGTNFNATVLGTDANSANFNDGIAFGSGNTFWAKRLGAPLRLMTFSVVTANAVTLQSFDTNSFAYSSRLGPIAVDNANHLMAAIEVVSGITGPEHIRLYDIADTTKPPVPLDIKDYAPNNANATAPPGYLNFGGGRLYTHVINNGLVTYSVDTVTAPAPTIVEQPSPDTRRILTGQSASYQVLAYPAATYTWRRGGFPIPNATNAVLNIVNATTNDSGTYSVLVANSAGSQASSNVSLTVIAPGDLYHFNPVWIVSPADGQPYMGSAGATTPNQRTIAYNARSNELYIVSRGGSSSQNFRIFAVAATNFSAGPPPVIKTLSTNGISGGGIGLVAIAAAADGAIYACNMDTTGNWKLYRWANSDSNTLPQLMYVGEPSGQTTTYRWGDVMAVRNTGAATQLIIDNYDSPRYVSVLSPGDANMTNFVPIWNVLGNGAGSSIGRSLQWGQTNAFWQKRRASALVNSTFDFTGTASPTLANYTNFPTTMGPAELDFTRNLLVGIRTNSGAPHRLELYDVSDLNQPLLITSFNFPQNPANANSHLIGQCFFAGEYVFALSGNNGVMALQLVSGPPTGPKFLADPENLHLVENNSGTLTITVDQANWLQWQKDLTNIAGATNASYVITNAHLSDAGNYRVIATNSFGASTSAVAVVTVTASNEVYHLSSAWSSAVATQPYLSYCTNANTPCFRSIAYNVLSNQIYIINRARQDEGFGPGDDSLTVSVLDAATGTKLYELPTNGIISLNAVGTNSINLVAMDVAEDGSIYAGNVCAGNQTDQQATFLLYRWSNSAPTTLPVLVYAGEPGNSTNTLRWGDVLDVRGSGPGTEIILDNQRLSREPWAAVLVPVDGSLNAFTNKPFANSYGGTTRIGRSLVFGTNNTYWLKPWGDQLSLISYDLAAQSSTVVANYTKWPATLGGIAMDFTRKLAAGVDFTGTASTPDTVNLYDISDLSQPALIAKYNFPTNQQPNANHISQCIFAGNRLFAIDANNGLVGFDIVAPGATLNISLSGNQVLIYWPSTVSGATLKSTVSLATPSWSIEGTGTLIGDRFYVTNTMPGTAKFYRLFR